MSKSKLKIIVLGLAILLAPIHVSSGQTVDECMETEIHTRTEEEIQFISTIAETTIDMKEEASIAENVEEWIPVNLHISYYTDLQCENTIGKETTDAIGNKLVFGTIAIPRDLPLGTEFKIEGYDSIFYGNDRGSKKYIKWIDENTMKVDMFIPRIKNEDEKVQELINEEGHKEFIKRQQLHYKENSNKHIR